MSMRKSLSACIGMASFALLASALGQTEPGKSNTAFRRPPVTMLDNLFAPKDITVDVGDTLTWQNDGDNTHTATSDDGTTFDTGDVKPGDTSKAVTFTKAGSIPYHCEYHKKSMKGTVTVKARGTFQSPITMTMLDNKFVPKTIHVKVGQSIVWENDGGDTHTATSKDGATFDTGDVNAGDTSKAVTFTKTGSIPYRCKHHRDMEGTVVVDAAARD